MAIATLKVLAGLLQLHGPGATVQSDHPGIDALLRDLREQTSNAGQASNEGVVSDHPVATQVAFRRGGFVRGARASGFRKGAVYPGAGAFRRGGFVRGY
jgi:hypothetical protein